MEDIKDKIEQRLQKQQENKEFKDVGRVAQTKKEKAAYRLISSNILSELEEDSVMAYNMVKKDSVWQKIDIGEEKARGVSSGAVYLKEAIRKAVPTRPKDDRNKRASYVIFLEKLQNDLLECYNVEQIDTVLQSYLKLEIDELIGIFINPEFLSYSDERKEEIRGQLKNSNSRIRSYIEYGGSTFFKKLIDEVFGTKLKNIMYRGSDSARITWAQAKEKEPITKEESEALIEALNDRKEKFVNANNETIQSYTNMSVPELMSAMNTKFNIHPQNKKKYKEDPEEFRTWVLGYYERNIRNQVVKWDERLKELQPKDNDWSWIEQKATKTESTKPKADRINSKPPLDYIKRTGGFKIDVISANEIAQTFGFKAVNYGNYVDDKWSKEHTKHFLGAISDLGEMLNINIKELNQLGGLSIAFGAKGRAGHLATYFPQTKDINLTKGNGDGSLAHEWGHYFDNVVIELDVKRPTNAFGSEMVGDDDELKDAFKELMDFFYKGNPEYTPKMPIKFYAQKNKSDRAVTFSVIEGGRWSTKELEIKSTIEETLEQLERFAVIDSDLYITQKRLFGHVIDAFGLESYQIPFRLKTSHYYFKSRYNYFAYCYKQPTIKIDEKVVKEGEIKAVADPRTKYWTSAVELFARAWETVVLKKLLDKNRVSNYLVNEISLQDIASESYHNPYPSGKELEHIEFLMDKIIDAAKRKYRLGNFEAHTDVREDEYLDYVDNSKGKVDEGMVVDKKINKKEVKFIDTVDKPEDESITLIDLIKKLKKESPLETEVIEGLELLKNA